MILVRHTHSEAMTYNRNSAITSLTRTSNGQGYGNIDQLTYTYTGNRLKAIADAASPNVYNGGFEFVNESNLTQEYWYNTTGDLIRDKNKGIALINYDLSGHPMRVQFTNGNQVDYVYAADGRKLREKHTTAVDGLTVSYGQTMELTPAQIMAADTTDYSGPWMFRRRGNPNVTYLDAMSYHFDGGYMTFYPVPVPSPIPNLPPVYNSVCNYHYYIRDYQGNNRVVVAHNGTVEQQNDYYAYGGPWGNTSTNQGLQPFKYNGKELDRVHGLDWYDYGARRYDPAFAQFTQMDPLCEKYPHLSPYTYCAGNPVRYVDPDGQRIWIVSGEKRYLYEDGTVFDNDVAMEKSKLPSYVNNVVTAFGEIGKSKTGRALITELRNSRNDFFIQDGDDNGFKPKDLIGSIAHNNEIINEIGPQNRLEGSGGTITWNPQSENGGLDIKGDTKRPSYIGLAHEMFHAKDANNGNLYLTDEQGKYNPKFKNLYKTEWRAVYGENLIRRELNIPYRKYYNTGVPFGPKLIKKGILLIIPTNNAYGKILVFNDYSCLP